MLLTLLALAHADDIDIDIDVEASAPTTVVVVGDAPTPDDPCDPHQGRDHNGRAALLVGYGMQFLPDAPAHHVRARHVAASDAYLQGEVRYLPASDLLWTGRASAGLDVLGGGNWDLTLGLFLGSAGTWDRDRDAAILYAMPIGGTEIGVGIQGQRLSFRYRWLAGFGVGPLDDLLTENELTLGYQVTDSLQVYGQYLNLDPGEAQRSSGVGIGLQARL